MFGTSHGMAGKGDKSRVSNLRLYNERLAEVDLPGAVQMERVGTKLVKHYGPPQPIKLADAPNGIVH